MKSKTETFAALIDSFRYKFDINRVFVDFLTMTICAFGRNPTTGLSYDEELYLETIKPYKDSELRFQFPKMLVALTNEMEERLGSHNGNDVLGEFYEQNLARKGSGQYFTPWSLCEFMAISLKGDESTNP